MTSPARRLSVAPARPTASADARVRAAAAVLAGEPLTAAAARAGVDEEQVLRWSQALAAGGAQAVGGIGVERAAEGPHASVVPVEDFLSVVAHELRTPLTAARSGLAVLAADVPEAVRRTVAGTVLARLADLDQLTLDVLDVVAVATGRDRLRPERVDLLPLLAAECAPAGLPAPHGAAVAVVADPVRLRTVVTTLLRHAARYASPAATTASVAVVGDAALLTLRLPGAPLDLQQAGAQLDPFTEAARGDGNGLALYVVRTLVVASGGMVGLAGTGEEVPEHERAVLLWVRLPLAPGATTPLPLPRPAVSP